MRHGFILKLGSVNRENLATSGIEWPDFISEEKIKDHIGLPAI
jgi:hypothetical protein